MQRGLRRSLAAKQRLKKYDKSRSDATLNRRIRQREHWMRTCNINLISEKLTKKLVKTSKQRNKDEHVENGNVEPEVDMVHSEMLAKTIPGGQLHHFTDGGLEEELGAWAMVTEGETAISGVALIDDCMSSTVTEMIAMYAVLQKIQKAQHQKHLKHFIDGECTNHKPDIWDEHMAQRREWDEIGHKVAGPI